jgi:predicted PurR-regulated permease PerM
MEKEDLKKYLFLAIVAIFILISFLIIRSFIIPLISAFVIAYLLKPIHRKLSKIMRPGASAFLCILMTLIILLGVFGVLIGSIVNQAYQSIQLSDLENAINQKLTENSIFNSIGLNLTEIKQNTLSALLSIISSKITEIPTFVIGLLITLLSTFYILINWELLASKVKEFIPFKNKDQVAKDISETTNNIVYGYFLIAILEFIVGVIGFYLSGVKLFILLPLLMGLLAFIPGLGPGLIWVPLALINFFQGDYPTAIGVLLTGLFISIVIETLLYGRIIGNRAKIHALIILLGIFGGVPIFGIFGFIIGPLILVYTIKLLEETIKQR